ncbi:MAG: hypothetical protein ASARMPREDX12_005157 [Alectoria sarmentosa]|nr:MAG: hypothetical protein ASARMPREDX12_005157 [Alectoria sarmentosa]
MPLTLSHCLPTDAPELARTSLAIWSPIPRNKVAFGKVSESSRLKMYEEDFYDGMTTKKQYKLPQRKHYLKVTDDATGEIAACGVWVYLPEGYCIEDDDEVVMGPLPEGANEELMREFCRMAGKMRGEHAGRHEAHWLLWLLGTHPNHERKGAGAQLIRWAFPQADAAGLRCYVDASKLGHPLYTKCGFEDVGEMRLDLDKYEGGKGMGVQRWVAMVREPQKV